MVTLQLKLSKAIVKDLVRPPRESAEYECVRNQCPGLKDFFGNETKEEEKVKTYMQKLHAFRRN